MFVVYILCLVSVFAPFTSSKTTLISLDGKTYLNGQLLVEASKSDIVNGPTRKLNIVRTLTLQEKLMIAKRLRKSNDMLSQLEEEKVKKLVEREIKLEKLFRGEEEENQRIENIVPNYAESDSETMQYGGLAE